MCFTFLPSIRGGGILGILLYSTEENIFITCTLLGIGLEYWSIYFRLRISPQNSKNLTVEPKVEVHGTKE
jgi:hypothetical protein